MEAAFSNISRLREGANEQSGRMVYHQDQPLFRRKIATLEESRVEELLEKMNKEDIDKILEKYTEVWEDNGCILLLIVC